MQEHWQDGIVGQTAALRTLSGLVRRAEQGRFVLLHGPSGVGKATTASSLASYLLCKSEDRPCGACLACRTPQEHPDLAWFEPEKAGGTIKIDQVREITGQAFFPPVNARHRVWVFSPMESLTQAAANAVLRILEEPPKLLWVLGISHNPSAVLMTLRSRAFKVPFQLLDDDALRTVLGGSVPSLAGTVERASLLGDKRFQARLAQWQKLLADRWYDPDAAVKFARASNASGSFQDFVLSLLLTYSTAAIAGGMSPPYNGTLSDWDRRTLASYLAERDALQQAVRDLNANVNPAFVCEHAARTVRRIRKELAATR